MARIAAGSFEALVFTFKDGLLSAVAHDLKIKIGRATLDLEADRVQFECEAASLTVMTAMKDGVESASTLSSSMKAEIERNLVNDVLNARKHSAIRFESTALTDTSLTGRLTLNGVTHEVRGTIRREGTRRIAEVKIDQRTFGITPYTAMFGALKVKPEVVVRVSAEG